MERLFHTRSPARCKLPLLTFLTSLSGLLAVSSLLLEAGAALVLETLQSLDPPLTSCCSTRPAGSKLATLVSLELEQVLAEDGAEPASACGLHFCCRFEKLDDCKVLNFHPVVDGQVFLCGGAREVEQCSRHLWLFQPQQMQVCLSTGVRG